MSSNRKPIRRETIAAVASEFAGQPVEPGRAEAYLAYMGPIYALFDGLRSVPLKQVEPAVVFKPIERKSE